MITTHHISNEHPATDPGTSGHHVSAATRDGARAANPSRRHGVAITVAVVLTGLFAGFFLTYSASVVLGLARVDDVTYVRTFQAINATIRNATFAVFFFGCVPSIGVALATARHQRPVVRRLLAVAAAACGAVVVITFAGSVPLNNELATFVDVDATTAALARDDFESTWNVLNLARSVLSVGGLVAVATAATLGRRAD